jgi:Zn-dependent metalloprotease
MIDVSTIASPSSPQSLPPGENSSTESSSKNRLLSDNKAKPNAPDDGNQRKAATNPQDLNPEELRELTELKQRDREVKTHEQAHVAAGGSHVRGGAQYEYEVGPDGRKYAVEGEVRIDTAKVPGDPEATIEKMQAIRNAALAPANPSAKDRSVAAEATRTENQARQELLTKRYAETGTLGSEKTGDNPDNSTPPEAGSVAISLGRLVDLVS